MRHIVMDEQYDYMACSDPDQADAEIPDSLYNELVDAIQKYRAVCNDIRAYLYPNQHNPSVGGNA